MQIIGHITLNISLFIYFVHFLPQIIHNQRAHKTYEISLFTHSFMILANSLDLVYGVGFHLQWQYILVDVVLLTYLFIQQMQILRDRFNKYILLHTFIIVLFLIVILVLILYKNPSKDYLLTFGSISGIVYNIYWLPQIYKNFRQKEAQGFSIYYILIGVISISCDISSAIFLGWPIVSVITSVCLLSLHLIQILQYFYYKRRAI